MMKTKKMFILLSTLLAFTLSAVSYKIVTTKPSKQAALACQYYTNACAIPSNFRGWSSIQ